MSKEADGTRKEITVSGGSIAVSGMQLSSGTQKFTVEFSLPLSLQFPSGSDQYLLATDGIRIDNNATAATLSGTIDSALFDSVSPCSEKADPTKGNRVYLYPGTGLSEDSLADVFTSDSSTNIPADAIAPL